MPRKRKQGTRAPNGASSIYQGNDGKWHGRVTVGVLDNGKPDRRHIERQTEAEVISAVRELERQRERGKVRRTGRAWTVEQWLTHWVENIAAPGVRPNTLTGYRVAVYKHLVPVSVRTGSTASNLSTWATLHKPEQETHPGEHHV